MGGASQQTAGLVLLAKRCRFLQREWPRQARHWCLRPYAGMLEVLIGPDVEQHLILPITG